MRPCPWSVPPTVSAFRRSRSHWNQLNATSHELAALAAILISLGDLRGRPDLTSFTTADWPAFSQRDATTLEARYNLGTLASPPALDAEAMFVQLRDFALRMKPCMERIRGEMRILWKLASWLPSCWTGAFLVPPEKARELVRWWTDSVAREAELREWVGGAKVLVADAEKMVRCGSGKLSGTCGVVLVPGVL